MRSLKAILGNVFALLSLLLVSNCSNAEKVSPELVLVASTPGFSEIKSKLGIAAETKTDFIRWHLTLRDLPGSDPEDTFSLHINYGESEPGTPGFKKGGENRDIRGTYTVTKNTSNTINGEIYHLKSFQLEAEIAFVRLNDNLYHLLTTSGDLMVGDGGFSYSLNRLQVVKQSAVLPLLTQTSTIFGDTARQVTYDGRTPCETFASDHLIKKGSDCYKLKWRIVLNRDPVTHEPTTYKMRKVVDGQARDVTGQWAVTKGVPGNDNVLIIRIDPGKGKETVSLLVGDSNVLFILDNEDKLYTGNGDFSYTLNKKP